MINEKCAKKYCCDDLSLIENYELAINDPTQTWDCHHRRESIYSAKDLIEIGEYWKRPAAELIFLTHSEHLQLHKKGVPKSEATKKALSEALKGVPNVKLSKKILQLTKSGEFIKEWPSAMEASRQLRIAQSSICSCCNVKRKSAGGYTWKYSII